METVTRRVPAKVNLSLFVTGRDGGYHTLDMVAASVGIYDTVTVTAGRDAAVTFRCAAPLPEDNTAVRAARAFTAAFGTGGVNIEVEKGIPMQAGLGGSSADAAGVLLAMAELYGVPDERLALLGLSVGSDVPYMLRGGFARVGGRGERITPLFAAHPLALLIAMPEGGVSTREAFRLFDTCGAPGGGDNAALTEALALGDLAEIAEGMANDLYGPACRLNAQIAPLLTRVRSSGAVGAVMTGSGSAVIGLFANMEQAARAAREVSGFAAFCRAVSTV